MYPTGNNKHMCTYCMQIVSLEDGFKELKKATVAHIRDIPSQNKDSELCGEDARNNCLGSISIS